MDRRRFDSLTKTLATAGTRRGLVRLLGALPLGVALSTLLSTAPNATAADDDHGSSHRRQRRKARHRHQAGDRKDNRKGKGRRKHPKRGDGPSSQPTACQPASKAQTCSGKCATVFNNCGAPEDCGACACDPLCAECFTCDPATGECIVDATQRDDACGQPGQVCQDDGSCACTPGGTTCGPCRTCQGNGTCSALCNGSQCCDGSTCRPGTADSACGPGGTMCDDCTEEPGQTCGGGMTPTPGVCGCIPSPTVLIVPSVSGQTGQLVPLTALLQAVPGGEPVPNQPIIFVVQTDGAPDVLQGRTDTNGVATVVYLIRSGPGTNFLTATFPQSPCYLSSQGTNILTVVP